MPYKAMKPCKARGCRSLTNGTYCEQHKYLETERKRNFNRYFREPSYGKRYGREWRAIRDQYIKRHPLCEECMKYHRLIPATEVHHILPLSDGGTHDAANLMSLCHECHSRITMTANNLRT